ncbi:MAG TPA: bacteriohemerythrin [Pseudomonadota bacterium]|nr:bacteriohemerythrin [Pseudomonadota bacterium]
MALITWTAEQFGTGVKKHDDEHKVLFGMLNTLHDAAAAHDRAAVGKALDTLIGFVVEHFASEEKNMIAAKYAAYDAHKAAHEKLVGICADLQKKFHAGQTDITTETTQFVKEWLNTHIPNVDRHYAASINAAGLGQ